jgi:hypothetical protein
MGVLLLLARDRVAARLPPEVRDAATGLVPLLP